MSADREAPGGDANDGEEPAPPVAVAFGVAAVTAFLTAIPCLLVAVLIVGGDRAVMMALVIALSAGAVAFPTAWWLHARATRDVRR